MDVDGSGDPIQINRVDLTVGDESHSFRLLVEALQLLPKSIAYLLGHNGSGKSLFLSAVVRQAHQGVRPVLLRQKADDNLALDLTVGENICLRLGSGYSARTQDINSRVARLPLGAHRLVAERWGQLVTDLSLGQKQILAFACVTCRRSRLLLLDEYLSAADIETSSFLLESVSRYLDQTMGAALIVSHDFEAALERADRILVLRRGRLVADSRRSEFDEGFLRECLRNVE